MSVAVESGVAQAAGAKGNEKDRLYNLSDPAKDIDKTSDDGEDQLLRSPSTSSLKVSSRSSSRSSRLGPLPDRISKAKRWIGKANAYNLLTEERILALEAEVKQLKRSKQDSSTDRLKRDSGRIDLQESYYKGVISEAEPLTTGNSAIPISTLTITRMNWAEFTPLPDSLRNREHAAEISLEPRSVLEVLVEDPPRVNLGRHRKHRSSFLIGKVEPTEVKPRTTISHDEVRSFPGSGSIPRRLRIRSPVLIRFLMDITGLDMFITDPDGDDETYERSLSQFWKHKIVILRPFKLFVIYENEIREHFRELEEKYQFEDTQEINDVKNEDGSVTSDSGSDDTNFEVQPYDTDTTSFKAFQHLRLLIQFMDEDLKPLFDLRRGLANGTTKKIAFDDLWHLFDYGQDVRTKEGKSIQILKGLNESPSEAFIVEAYCLDFDGSMFGPKQKRFNIPRYEGLKDITALSIFPLSHDPTQRETHSTALQRGERFLGYLNESKVAHCQYTGLTLDEQPEQVDSQVIIDNRLSFLKNSYYQPHIGLESLVSHDIRETRQPSPLGANCLFDGCCGKDWIYRDYQLDNKRREAYMNLNSGLLDTFENIEDMSDDEKILLPYLTYGFVLRTRKWAKLGMDLITNVDYGNSWEELIIPPEIKDNVLALVENRLSSRDQGSQDELHTSMDLVRGKGKGLIILLHGEPGVGKTSTAECVADHTKRPLFSITCGDIGVTANAVEENLENNFQLAHRWGCVLLLDEADVFLAKRDKSDLQRNAIVSVFLRTLEYYSGILFLTTNRTGAIDPAFKSRIHISLLYPRLDKPSTATIWKNHLRNIKKQFKEQGKKIEIDKKDILAYARSHHTELSKTKTGPWNGRQIRNAFQTAIALSLYSAKTSGIDRTPKLNRDQFIKVAEASKHFDDYLKSVHGGRTEAEIAKREQWRDDDNGGSGGSNMMSQLAMNEFTERQVRVPPSPSPIPTLAKKKVKMRKEVELESDHSSDEDSDDDDDDDESDSE
ncbi:MAG: hypothetical protein M1834_000956 [Cirrosporium novae-zelandiae]|nr:MAG: hypothetical protein M1834_000956 [Cirrosporium novae-zelandiae]